MCHQIRSSDLADNRWTVRRRRSRAVDERYTRIIRRNLLTVFDRLITITGFTGVRASLDHGVRTLVCNCIVKVLQSDSRRPCGYVARSSGLPRRHARPVEIVKVVQPPGSSFENHLHLLCTYLPLPIRAHFFVELSSYTFPNNPTQLFLLLYHLYILLPMRPLFFQIIHAIDIDFSRFGSRSKVQASRIFRNFGSLASARFGSRASRSQQWGEGDRLSCANLVASI